MKLRNFTAFVLFTVVTVGVLFVMIEGVASTLILINDLVVHFSREPQGTHTRYDAELGWVNLPNVHIEDRFGPGISLRTNSQSFRNDRDFTMDEPPGKLRVICSGDSFTLGYGVDDQHTWCNLLTVLNGRLETVNMGQGGYGIDQSYLWYKRDGSRLEHSLHVFAFVTDDFYRMLDDAFEGYGKPVLRLNDGELVVDNLPVPRRPFYVPWMARFAPYFRQLRSVRLANRLLGNPTSLTETEVRWKERMARQVSLKVFADLTRLNEAKSSVLALVYLPDRSDYSDSKSDSWRNYLRGELARQGLVYFDLVESFRELSPQEFKRMFRPGDGHYTKEGNEYVAQLLYRRLLSIPELSIKLAAHSSRT